MVMNSKCTLASHKTHLPPDFTIRRVGHEAGRAVDLSPCPPLLKTKTRAHPLNLYGTTDMHPRALRASRHPHQAPLVLLAGRIRVHRRIRDHQLALSCRWKAGCLLESCTHYPHRQPWTAPLSCVHKLDIRFIATNLLSHLTSGTA